MISDSVGDPTPNGRAAAGQPENAPRFAGLVQSPLFSFVRRLIREKPLGAICLAITLLMLLVAIVAPLIAPYGMNETRVGPFSAAPSARFWLGTDNLGR